MAWAWGAGGWKGLTPSSQAQPLHQDVACAGASLHLCPGALKLTLLNPAHKLYSWEVSPSPRCCQGPAPLHTFRAPPWAPRPCVGVCWAQGDTENCSVGARTGRVGSVRPRTAPVLRGGGSGSPAAPSSPVPPLQMGGPRLRGRGDRPRARALSAQARQAGGAEQTPRWPGQRAVSTVSGKRVPEQPAQW